MAERLPRQSAALIAQHMDTIHTDPFCIFDESEPNEEKSTWRAEGARGVFL